LATSFNVGGSPAAPRRRRCARAAARVAGSARWALREPEAWMEARFSCWAIQELLDGRIFRLAIKNVWTAPWSDLALLSVEAVPDRRPTSLTMSMTPPAAGAKVFAFGYHDGAVEIDADTVTIKRNGSTSVGTVIEVHDERRDKFSYVTSLWPLLAIEIDVTREGHPPGRYPVQELARDGMVAARDWERVVLDRDTGGKIVGISYRH